MSDSGMIDNLRASNVTKMVELSACAIFLWDYLLTVGMEVQYIWPGPWTAIKVIYFIQRYLPFLDSLWLTLHFNFGKNLSVETCALLYEAGKSIMSFGLAFSELLLTYRAWAVWNRTRVLTHVLPALYALCFIPTIIIHFKVLPTMQFSALLPQFRGCIPTAGDNLIVVNWALLLGWDAFILVLMIIPAAKAYHYRVNSALYTAVYTEGILYYVFLFATSTMNILLMTIPSIPASYRFMFTTSSRCIHALLTSRVLLHIRASVDPEVDRTAMLDAIHFETRTRPERVTGKHWLP